MMTPRRGLLRAALPPVVALALGALFYLLVRRDEAWFVARLVEAPWVGARLVQLRVSAADITHVLPPVLLGATPDALWAFAVGGLVCALAPPGPARASWGAIGALLVVGYEIAQHWHLAPGTFDWADLAAQGLMYPVGWMGSKIRT